MYIHHMHMCYLICETKHCGCIKAKISFPVKDFVFLAPTEGKSVVSKREWKKDLLTEYEEEKRKNAEQRFLSVL